MNRKALLGGLMLAAFATFSHADDKPLRIGIEAAYPPFAYKTPEAASPASTTTSAMRCAKR